MILFYPSSSDIMKNFEKVPVFEQMQIKQIFFILER